jgi:hypothetical protein
MYNLNYQQLWRYKGEEKLYLGYGNKKVEYRWSKPSIPSDTSQEGRYIQNWNKLNSPAILTLITFRHNGKKN